MRLRIELGREASDICNFETSSPWQLVKGGETGDVALVVVL